MRFAVEVVPFGYYANPLTVVAVAKAAEGAGWEGLFVWDHLAFVGAGGVPSGDPWVTLAAVVVSTDRLRVGIDVAVLPRRRPQLVAQQLTALDLLSGGRTILGCGLGGVAEEFTAFGESGDLRTRARRLDEALDVIDGLLRGRRVDYVGEHYAVRGVTLAPLPIQQPRPPIWIGGASLAALRRASRWDGWVIPCVDVTGKATRTPQWVAERLTHIRSRQNNDAPFEVAVTGQSDIGQHALAREYVQAGATWWLESLHGYRGSPDQMLRRVSAGPPA